MQHFICTGGCDGEASAPGMCQAEECKKEGEQLTPCDCEDGSHSEKTQEEDISEDLK